MKFRALLFLIFSLLISGSAFAQSKITFNVDMRSELEDSVFVPSRGDVLEIKGDFYPLNNPRGLVMVDDEPIDSVYSITVNFSSRYRNKSLTYNYFMTVNGQTRTEVLPRSLQLQGREIDLTPLYFNAFSW